MAKITATNQTPATGAEAIFNFKSTLVSAGWVVKSSSDGTTYNSTGDQITTTSSLAATNAWFRIQDPGGRREYTLQRTTTNLLWRIKFSESDKFTGGSPGATQTPSATDEAVLHGSGTDASPTGATFFGTENTYRCHTIAYTTSDIGNVYSFFFFTTDKATVTPLVRTQFFVDSLHTTNALDVSPQVIWCTYLTAAPTSTQAGVAGNTTGSWKAWYKYGLTGSSFVVYGAMTHFNGSSQYVVPSLSNNTISPNGYDNNEDIVRFIVLARHTTDGQQGVKGICMKLAFNVSYVLAYPRTWGVSGSDPYIYLHSTLAIPWAQNVAGAV